MSLFDEVYNEIEQKRELKINGGFNGIPFCYPRFSNYVPSIDKGMFHSVLGSTGIGKSKYVRHTYLYQTYSFAKVNNYPIKILYFALEDPRKLVYKKIIAHYLWERQQIFVPTQWLDSKERPLDKHFLDLIKQDRVFFEELEDDVYIVNDASTPAEMFKYCEKVHARFGSTHHIIAIVDNFSNIGQDTNHKSDWEAIGDFAKNYARKLLCKQMDITVVGVVQVDLDSEKASFRNSGKGSISSIEPNMGSFGENKVVSRSMHFVTALFSPWRYEILRYPYNDESKSYDINILRNKFRSLIHLKSNEEETAPRIGLYFDGAKELYHELPLLEEKDKLQELYERIIVEEREKKERLVKPRLF